MPKECRSIVAWRSWERCFEDLTHQDDVYCSDLLYSMLELQSVACVYAALCSKGVYPRVAQYAALQVAIAMYSCYILIAPS